jgi:glucose-1-phosphate adenylyltransferase
VDWPFRTATGEYAPALMHAGAQVARSLVAEGCAIYGTVRNSVCFPGVRVGRGTVVESSILLDGVQLGDECRLDRAIVDKETVVGDGAVLGAGDEYPPNEHYPAHLTSGLVLVGREGALPPGLRLGRNACVEVGARPQDFTTLDVPPGGFVPHAA